MRKEIKDYLHELSTLDYETLSALRLKVVAENAQRFSSVEFITLLDNADEQLLSYIHSLSFLTYLNTEMLKRVMESSNE